MPAEHPLLGLREEEGISGVREGSGAASPRGKIFLAAGSGAVQQPRTRRGGLAACQGKQDTAPKQTARAQLFGNSSDAVQEKKHVKADKYPLLTLINARGFPWARSFLSAPAAQHRDGDGHEVSTAPST